MVGRRWGVLALGVGVLLFLGCADESPSGPTGGGAQPLARLDSSSAIAA